MSPIHQYIINAIRKIIGDEDKNSPLFSCSDDELVRAIFVNYRTNGSESFGLRLSTLGFDYLSKLHPYVSVDYPEYTIQDILFLDKTLTAPYYVTTKFQAIFNRELGVLLKMVGNITELRNYFEEK